jgi:MFS transporter (putative signal transducer)
MSTVTAAAVERQDETGRLPLHRVLIAVGGIYLVQSLVGGFTFQGIPAALRASGVPLDVIGLFSLIMLPWALKFLWAPAIECYRLAEGRARRSRHVIALMQGGVALCLVFIAFSGLEGAPLLFALLLCLALFSSTADIACDGYAIQQLSAGNRGWGNTAQVGGGYLGMVVGGGLFLVILGSYGLVAACLTMACIVVVLTLPFLLTPEPRVGDGHAEPHRPSLGFAFARREVRYGLLIAIAFEVGVRLTQSMSAPFLVDRGFDLVSLGFLKGSGAILSGVLGTLIGGLLVHRWGARRCVGIAIAAQTATLIVLAIVSAAPAAPHWLLGAVIIAKSIAMAFGFVSLYSLLMGLSSMRQAGVDFTLFQCADALIAGLAGVSSGMIAQRLGFPTCFGIAAGFGVAGCILLPILMRRAGIASSAGTVMR